MRILVLGPLETLILDIIAWLLFHLGIGHCFSKIPLKWLNPELRLFQTFRWERGGAIYQRLFRVRSWKAYIPDGIRLRPNNFSIKDPPVGDAAYLERWLRESIRSELLHLTMIVPSFLLFLWNSVRMGWLNVSYALVSNLIPIILQRFNRPRIRRLLARVQRSAALDDRTPAPMEYGLAGSQG